MLLIKKINLNKLVNKLVIKKDLIVGSNYKKCFNFLKLINFNKTFFKTRLIAGERNYSDYFCILFKVAGWPSNFETGKIT